MREGGLMDIRFELDGLEEIIDRAEQMYGNSDSAMDAYLLAYGNVILEEEKRLVRVDTGKTKRALKLSKVKTRKTIKSIWIGDVDKIRGAIPYYLEYGNSHGNKFPFMRPAAYRKKAEGMDKGLEAFEEALRNGNN